MLVWCVETQAEWDAAVDCLALRFSPNSALENAMSRWHLEDSLFYTNTVEIDMCLVRGDPSEVGCGSGMAPIAFIAKWALENAISRWHLQDTLF